VDQDIAGDIADISKSVTAVAGALSSLRELIPVDREVALKRPDEVAKAIGLLATLVETSLLRLDELSKRMDRIEETVTATGQVAVRADRVAMALKASVEPLIGKQEWARLEVLSQFTYEQSSDHPYAK